MDENYVIPNQEQKPAPAGNEQPPAAGVTENSRYRYLSPDINAMTDEPYDREGYLEALQNDNRQTTAPQTMRQMVGEASRRLSEMVEQEYWNENIHFHQEVEKVNEIGATLDEYRDTITGSTGEEL